MDGVCDESLRRSTRIRSRVESMHASISSDGSDRDNSTLHDHSTMSDTTVGLRRSARVQNRLAALQESLSVGNQGVRGLGPLATGMVKAPLHTSTPRVAERPAANLASKKTGNGDTKSQKAKNKGVLQDTSNVKGKKESKAVHMETLFEEEIEALPTPKETTKKQIETLATRKETTKKQICIPVKAEKPLKAKTGSEKHPTDDKENTLLGLVKQYSSEDSHSPVGCPGQTPAPKYSVRFKLNASRSKKPSEKSKSSASKKGKTVDTSQPSQSRKVRTKKATHDA